jgi:hypothetical protein
MWIFRNARSAVGIVFDEDHINTKEDIPSKFLVYTE